MKFKFKQRTTLGLIKLAVLGLFLSLCPSPLRYINMALFCLLIVLVAVLTTPRVFRSEEIEWPQQ